MASLVTTSISRNGLDQVFGVQRSPRFLCYFSSDKPRYHSCTSLQSSRNHAREGETRHRAQSCPLASPRTAHPNRQFIKLFMYAITSRIWTLRAIVKAVKQVSRRWPMAVSGWFALTNLLIDLPVMFTGTVEVGEVCWSPYLAFVLGRPGTFRSHWCSSLPTASTKASTASALSSISA
ncbi:hypothetical protein EDB84DRAFT_1438205 [Lactarius hengduanensis]|nr:hypothetical protein EDB84DRAFT_1438205 [Lactarius hengduanensis]